MDPCQAGRCQEARFPAAPCQEEPSLVVLCRAEHYLVERRQEARSLAEPCPAGPFLVEPSQAERCLEISTGRARRSGLVKENKGVESLYLRTISWCVEGRFDLRLSLTLRLIPLLPIDPADLKK